uniref:Uncharacterized protein n=1 Tax=Candidatus Kentrum sp. UNK TaxID=2126344 RepID=A0A451AGV7_9GAMM|nr:MAG: Protein of unknown function (DUF1634) [Candidatus Kentron sp. UNK]VFK71398.1 MAG: Protein of unknown function (DUF1634) [Candidatus Kentron sp. UNK]
MKDEFYAIGLWVLLNAAFSLVAFVVLDFLQKEEYTYVVIASFILISPRLLYKRITDISLRDGLKFVLDEKSNQELNLSGDIKISTLSSYTNVAKYFKAKSYRDDTNSFLRETETNSLKSALLAILILIMVPLFGGVSTETGTFVSVPASFFLAACTVWFPLSRLRTRNLAVIDYAKGE